jgi:hypothetical protein
MDVLEGEEEIEEYAGTLEAWKEHVAELLDRRLRDVLFFYWAARPDQRVSPTCKSSSWAIAGTWSTGTSSSRTERSRRLSGGRTSWSSRRGGEGDPGKNGRPHGIDVFGSVPAETTNQMPSLLLEAVVKQAYFDFPQWQERVEGGAWDCLAGGHFGRIVEPNHLQRSLDILERAAEDPHRWLEEIEVDRNESDGAFRQRLFDAWFETS